MMSSFFGNKEILVSETISFTKFNYNCGFSSLWYPLQVFDFVD